MATTLSTNTRWLDDGARFRPKVVRLLALRALTTGDTESSLKIDTALYRSARLYWDCQSLSTDSTAQVYIVTGATTDPTEVMLASSNAAVIDITTTGKGSRTFTGLNRWSRVRCRLDGNGGPCTGLDIDIELV